MDDATGVPGESKACTGCGEVKSLTDFSYDKRHADGRQSQCRTCTKARQQRWKEAGREHYLELRQAEHQRRKPKAAAYQKANQERLTRAARERRAALTGAALEAVRERHRAASAAYLRAHPEVCAERIRAWQHAHPEKATQAVHRRRARKHGNGDCEDFTRAEIGDRDGWVCWLCDLPVDPGLRWPARMSQSLDHVIPLALGGEHTRANSRLAHWICNVRRGADRKRAA